MSYCTQAISQLNLNLIRDILNARLRVIYLKYIPIVSSLQSTGENHDLPKFIKIGIYKIYFYRKQLQIYGRQLSVEYKAEERCVLLALFKQKAFNVDSC